MGHGRHAGRIARAAALAALVAGPACMGTAVELDADGIESVATPAADAGRQSSDSGPQAADAGAAEPDAGRPIPDGGQPAGDAGQVAPDSGSGASDAGALPDAGVPPSPTGDFRIVGYFPSWGGDVSTVRYDYLTHINYAFLLPYSDGTFTGVGDTGRLDDLVQRAHAAGVKVSISVGGWNGASGVGGDDSAFHALAADPTTRARFVENVVAFASQHDLDGVDIDWEFPTSDYGRDDLALLLAELAAALHPQGKLVTAAVQKGDGGGFPTAAFDTVDFLNFMAYDYGWPHAGMDVAQGELDYWKGKGLPASKSVVGVPFYGREPYTAYSTLVGLDSSAPYKDEVNGLQYNGIPTIQKKTCLARSQGGGIMIWELTMDTAGDTSLLRAIWEAAQPGFDCSAL